MTNSLVAAPPTITDASPSRSSARRIVLVVLQALALYVVAVGVFIAYQTGLLGPGLSIGLPVLAAVALVLGIVRLARRRAHVAWLRLPWRRGSRALAAQFLLRAALWLTSAYAATLAFPRFMTGAGETTASYVTIWVSAAVLLAAALAPRRTVNWVTLVATVVALTALSAQLVRIHLPVRVPATPIAAPVHGTWIVGSGGRSNLVNHHFSTPQQSYALDLSMPFDRVSYAPPTELTDYPAFGQPVLAPGDGVVVRAFDVLPDVPIGGRDPIRPVGNHIVVDLGDGRFVLLAHLRSGSLTVAEGDRVRAGQPLAQVGNSGNSTEPHLHLQVQTGPDLLDRDGRVVRDLRTLPISFADADRVRSGQRSAEARDLRRNDLVIVP
jgi:peptidase M23-like protein